MKYPKLAVFDCDGTLADVQYISIEAARSAFKSLGLPCPSRTDILQTSHLRPEQAMERLGVRDCPSLLNEIVSIYCENLRQLGQQMRAQEAMFEGASRLLVAIASHEEGLLGIATGKSRRGTARFLAQNGIDGLFCTVQTADDAPPKPHPSLLQRAMIEAGVEPQDTWMIGDTVNDIVMASRAGVKAIGVSWGYSQPDDLKRAGALAVADTFQELQELLCFPAANQPARPTAAVAA